MPFIPRQILVLVIIAFLSSGCAELNSLISSGGGAVPLSESEVVDGLKEALINGSNNASALLSSTDGYYGDELVKILLPGEADIILDNLSKIPGGKKLVDDLILNINRAAEDAAKEVAPIFINSIKQMTINDAFGILKGEDNAATLYLAATSREDLYNLYKPKVKESTNKEIIGGVSAKESWDVLTGNWNRIAGSVAGKLAGFETVNTDLDHYLCNKALDGMFLKVQDEELKIRKNIDARVSPLLKKVFGSLDN